MTQIEYIHVGGNFTQEQVLTFNNKKEEIKSKLSTIQEELDSTDLIIKFFINTKTNPVKISMHNIAVIEEYLINKIKTLIR